MADSRLQRCERQRQEPCGRPQPAPDGLRRLNVHLASWSAADAVIGSTGPSPEGPLPGVPSTSPCGLRAGHVQSCTRSENRDVADRLHFSTAAERRPLERHGCPMRSQADLCIVQKTVWGVRLHLGLGVLFVSRQVQSWNEPDTFKALAMVMGRNWLASGSIDDREKLPLGFHPRVGNVTPEADWPGSKPMRSFHGAAIGMLLFAEAAAAQVSVAELSTPPADARLFTIMSIAGRHGTTAQWRAPDGTQMGRLSLILRGQVWEE